MSSTHVKRIAKTRTAVEYELYGAKGSAKYRKNIKDGTTRVAAVTHDHASLEQFLRRAEALAEKYGRKIEARSVIQSFSKDEFDPSKPEDVQRVNDLGYMFAKELHPNSDVLVITHTDGCGGHAHNHIKVINHDNVTGKALRGGDMHWQFNKVNDRLMEREGHRVIESTFQKDKSKEQPRSYWEHQRDAEGVTAFEQRLGDNIMDSLSDPRAVDTPSYRKLLAEKGIELIEKETLIVAAAVGTQPAHMSVGWTYLMMDEFTPSRRTPRRRAASRLSEEFTHKGAHEIFELNKESRAHNVISTGEDRAARAAASRAAAARLGRIELGDVASGGINDHSAGDLVEQSLGAGDSPELNGGGDVDLSGARDKLLAAAEERRERQQRDLQDPDVDRGAAGKQRGSAPAGRDESKPRRPFITRDDDRVAKRDEGYDRDR